MKVHPSPCTFCNGKRQYNYRLNENDIYQCIRCKTLGVANLPSEHQIADFYSGFNFETSVENYAKVNTTATEAWMNSLALPISAKMLDVGGGGGFFAKAFEEFGLGESFYIDIDDKACAFARDTLKLKNVLQISVEDYTSSESAGKFDFIYCRHVVEHLRDPANFILECEKLLKPGGKLVVQCPNGLSKEGLLFPNRWGYFQKQLQESNGWNKHQAFAYTLTDKYGWGLDPIRHLWAISGDAIPYLFGERKDIVVSTNSASLADSVFSPYHSGKGLKGRLRNKAAYLLFGRIFQGVHLIATIYKK